MKYPILIASIVIAFVLVQHGVIFQIGGNYFRGEQERLATASAEEIAREVQVRMDAMRRGAETMAGANASVIAALAGISDPDPRDAAVAQATVDRFPLLLGLGIVDRSGVASTAAGESVGDSAVLSAAAALLAGDGAANPNTILVVPEGPKTSISAVVPWQSPQGERVAVVLRFSADALAQVLDLRPVKGHNSALVRAGPSGPTILVGGSAHGQTADAQSGEFLAAIRVPIPETQWEAAVFPEPNLYSDFFWFRLRILGVSGGLMTLAVLVMLGFALRRERMRRASVTALRQSEERFRQLADAAFEGIVFFDDERILDVNQAAEKMLGYERGELNGRRFIDLVSPEHRDAIASLREMGPERAGELLAQRKDGSTVHVEFASKAIEYQGAPARVATVRDVSVRKHLEQMQRDFVANVSHELRTPLTSIRGALGLITGNVVGAKSEKRRELIEIAYRNSERLTVLIEDILDFEKIEAGQLVYEFQPEALRPLLEKAIEANAPYAERLGVTINLQEPVPEELIKADAHRVLQVLTNLLSNAAKFSPQGETVIVRARAADGEVCVEIVDRGPGVPAHFETELFGRFRQADAADSRDKGGSGLGLAISKAIIESHGGTIGYRRGPRGGSIFFFKLSLALTEVAKAS